MAKKIYITESQLDIIREFENTEILYDDFESKVRSYMEELRTNPCKPKYDEFFTKNDIPEKELLNKMIDIGLISKKDSITEPEDANNKKNSVHTRKYIFSGKDFDGKLGKLYNSFFKNNRRIIGECDCGGAMGGGGAVGDITAPGGSTTTDSAGNYQYDVPLFGVQRRGIGTTTTNSKKENKKKKKDNTLDLKPALERKPNGSISVNVTK